MKVITKYVADNGEEYNTEAECLKQDALISEVNDIMRKLKPESEAGEGFFNGNCFIQHDIKAVEVARMFIDAVIFKYTHLCGLADLNTSYIARVLHETKNVMPIAEAYSRLIRIDRQGREWGQLYYTNLSNNKED